MSVKRIEIEGTDEGLALESETLTETQRDNVHKQINTLMRAVSPHVEAIGRLAPIALPGCSGIMVLFADAAGRVATISGTVEIEVQIEALENALVLMKKIHKSQAN